MEIKLVFTDLAITVILTVVALEAIKWALNLEKEIIVKVLTLVFSLVMALLVAWNKGQVISKETAIYFVANISGSVFVYSFMGKYITTQIKKRVKKLVSDKVSEK